MNIFENPGDLQGEILSGTHMSETMYHINYLSQITINIILYLPEI